MIITFSQYITESKKQGLKKISKQEAIDKKMFGPVYHGTRPDNWPSIFQNGFKIFYETPSNTYLDDEYELGFPPPLHHLGYGIYFTTVKAIAKRFNWNSEKNLKEFYLDVHNVHQFRHGSMKNMMRWWLENGYDGELGKKDRVKATKKMTNYLKSKYDAIWFKDKGMYGAMLDGDQIVVFDPSKIYMIDESLSGEKEIGSTVVAKKDIMRKTYETDTETGETKQGLVVAIPKGTPGKILNKRSVDDMLKIWTSRGSPKEHWAYGSEFVYTVRFKKGGTSYNILDDDIF
jgi:hypothetical protein